MRSSTLGFLWMVTVALLFAVNAGAQTTWYVDASAAPPGMGTQARPYASIQYAIDQPKTVTGDTLLVAPGLYPGAIIITNKDLSIRSTGGPLVTRLVSSTGYSAVYVNYAKCTLEGFTIHTSGTGVTIDGSAIVSRCVIVGNAQGLGHRGIRAEVNGNGPVRVEHCTIAGFSSGLDAHPYACVSWRVDSTLFLGNVKDLGFASTCGAGAVIVKYCAFQAFPTGIGGWIVEHPVIHPDLGVWDWEALDVHLEPLSVCIDAGNPALPLDPDGTRADIGAVPYDSSYADTPTTYCTGKVHSGGCAPRVSWSGTPTLSGADDLVLRANLALDGMAGKFIWSFAPQATPFGGGTLCIAAPFVRGPILQSGGDGKATNCSGVFVWPVSHAYMQANLWQPGQILYAQAWGRDIGSAFPEKSQLSDAIVFQVLP